MAIPNSVKLIIAICGIFGSFSYFALLQEDLFKKEYAGKKFKSTFFMMVAERGVNALVALVFIMIFGGSGLKIPIADIFASGATQMLAMAASNEALRYVSYPTQVLGKSCKMVPVMLFGILIGGKYKDYSLTDYIQVVLVTVGVVIFNFGAPVKAGKGGGSDSTYGLALIAASLALDGFTGGLQALPKPRTLKLEPSTLLSMLYTNLAGAIVALGFAALTGQIQEGLALCRASPEFVNALGAFSLCSALGQCFIYYTVTEFSPLLLATVTTTRKIFSTVYSVFRNPDNSLNQMQWSGCITVFVAIIGEMALKQVLHPKP
ncbi:UAA transporter [Baffinella frigidus]|nr:UAA transporter [Cryptophyta sp. CCMP2293]